MKLLLLFRLGIALLLIATCVVNSLRFDQPIVHSSKLVQPNMGIPYLESKNIEQYTESPFDQGLEEETTTAKYSFNTTLDVNGTFPNWKISPINIKYWLEYYNNTDEIEKETATDTCTHIINNSPSELSEVEGIWVACQDPHLPRDCSGQTTLSTACHPFMAYWLGDGTQLGMRTVKINLSLRGLAIARLTTGTDKIGGSTELPCFDYSIRRDPFSQCEYIKVEANPTTGWAQVKSNFSAYDDAYFRGFTIQLIARFEDDVALVDKVEATDYLLCGDEDILCTTTPAGPTHSTPTTESERTPLSTDTVTPTTSTTTTTTTPETTTITTSSSTELINLTSTTPAQTDLTTLDIMSDAENERKWEIPNLSSRWFEYYPDSASLIGQANNPNICANNIAPIAEQLKAKEGIWSSCYDPDSALINNHFRQHLVSPPNINYSSNTEVLISLTANFYLHGSAYVRLHVGNKCIDYSYSEVPLSTCDLFPIRQDGVYWRGAHWDANSFPEQLKEFKIELMSPSAGDVVLLDKLSVTHTKCNSDECSQHSSTTTTIIPTTEDATELSETTEKETDCPTSETTTITESTTEISKTTSTTDRNTESTKLSSTTPTATTDDNTESSSDPSTPCPTLITGSSSSSTTPRSTTPGDRSNSNTLTLNLIAFHILTIAIFLLGS